MIRYEVLDGATVCLCAVELTAQIFTRLLADGTRASFWQDLPSLDRFAGRAAPWESEVSS